MAHSRPEGEFLEVPEFDMDTAAGGLAGGHVCPISWPRSKIEPEVVENMLSWPHSGFSVDQSVFLAGGRPAGDRAPGTVHDPLPVQLVAAGQGDSKTGQVVYKAEKDACRAFPDPQGTWKRGQAPFVRSTLRAVPANGACPLFHDELAAGPKRNFQILSPLEFLAEFTQHIPPRGAHLIRYYGWYSNKTRGLRRKAAEQAATANSPLLPGEGQGVRAAPPPVSTPARCSQTWAMLIKRVYEIDPLACPRCGGAMKVIAFIEPPQGALIEKILRHCGLWNPSSPRAPPADWGLSQFSSATRSAAAKMGLSPSAAAASPPEFFDERDEPGEWTYVDIDTFEATF